MIQCGHTCPDSKVVVRRKKRPTTTRLRSDRGGLVKFWAVNGSVLGARTPSARPRNGPDPPQNAASSAKHTFPGKISPGPRVPQVYKRVVRYYHLRAKGLSHGTHKSKETNQRQSRRCPGVPRHPGCGRRDGPATRNTSGAYVSTPRTTSCESNSSRWGCSTKRLFTPVKCSAPRSVDRQDDRSGPQPPHRRSEPSDKDIALTKRLVEVRQDPRHPNLGSRCRRGGCGLLVHAGTQRRSPHRIQLGPSGSAGVPGSTLGTGMCCDKERRWRRTTPDVRPSGTAGPQEAAERSGGRWTATASRSNPTAAGQTHRPRRDK